MAIKRIRLQADTIHFENGEGSAWLNVVHSGVTIEVVAHVVWSSDAPDEFFVYPVNGWELDDQDVETIQAASVQWLSRAKFRLGKK
jgi:hypothetical protein